MNSTDVILLTLVNVASCIVLPKLVDIFLAHKTKLTQLSPNNSEFQPAKIQLTSFPYCTAYSLTGSQYCKFRPDFCPKCSPN